MIGSSSFVCMRVAVCMIMGTAMGTAMGEAVAGRDAHLGHGGA